MNRREKTPEQKAFLCLIFPLLFNILYLFGVPIHELNDTVIFVIIFGVLHIFSYIGLTIAIQTKYSPLIFMGILTTSWLILTTTHLLF